jgi:DNA gyrase subunit A
VVSDEEDLMIVTQGGIVIRLNVSEISVMSRYAQGVKLITLENDEVATVARVQISDGEENASGQEDKNSD